MEEFKKRDGDDEWHWRLKQERCDRMKEKDGEMRGRRGEG